MIIKAANCRLQIGLTICSLVSVFRGLQASTRCKKLFSQTGPLTCAGCRCFVIIVLDSKLVIYSIPCNHGFEWIKKTTKNSADKLQLTVQVELAENNDATPAVWTRFFNKDITEQTEYLIRSTRQGRGSCAKEKVIRHISFTATEEM